MWDVKRRLTERIFEKKSQKILEPMFDHGTTRIWSFTDVHCTAAVCRCAVLSCRRKKYAVSAELLGNDISVVHRY
jgi:cytosine/adenosine deaminase-related metal-dependent hydrolase